MNDSQPVFLQIIEIIENDIITQVYHPNDLIISTTQISKLYSINPSTAVKAVSHLMEEGILYKRPGIGMCVAQGARERLIQRRREDFFGPRLKAVFAEAQTLGISVDEIIESLKEREQRHD